MKLIFKFLSASAVMVLVGSTLSYGQDQPKKEQTVRMAANEKYDKAGKFKRIVFGDHYRKEWATPIDIAVLDLDAEAGGLIAEKLGGGHQTKSLRLKGADGNEYVLRSVKKDP